MSASAAPASSSQSNAVAGGYGGVGGVAVNLPRAACGHQNGARADSLQTILAVQQVGSNHAAIGDHQPGNRCPLGKTNALVDAGKGRQRAADLRARRVAVGVQNARQRVRALARAQQLAGLGIEGRAPLDQLRHAHRPLGHQRLRRGAINQPVPGVDGVFQVQRNVRVALHGHGNAALRIVGIGLGHRLLGDDQNIAVARQFDRRAQPGHARSHHQKVHLRRCCHKDLGYHLKAGTREHGAE